MDKVQTTMEAVAAHNLVPEQLLERERQRHEETLLRKQNSNLLAEEHPDFIAQKFSELAADIKSAINESVKQFLHKAAAEEIATQDECDSPQQKFAGHAARISELQRYLTACTRFLPDYKIKACTQIISELNKSLDESRQQVMPKKKFGFSARKAAKKPKVMDSNDEKEKCDPSKPIGNVLNPTAEPPVVSLNSTSMSLNRKHMDRQAEYILESGDDINSHDVTLVNLKNCFVDLRGHASSVRFDNLTDCVVLIGPVSSSVYVENCTNCTFAIACQQLRCHNSNSCRICLHVTCRAVMEDCHDMHFGNYKHSYDGIEQDFQAAGLDESINNYADIADFNWLSPHVPSPNWCLMKTDESIDFDSLRRDFEAKYVNVSSVVGKQT